MLTLKSYPKVNICLGVQPRDSTGLHKIKSRLVLCLDCGYDLLRFDFRVGGRFPSDYPICADAHQPSTATPCSSDLFPIHDNVPDPVQSQWQFPYPSSTGVGRDSCLDSRSCGMEIDSPLGRDDIVLRVYDALRSRFGDRLSRGTVRVSITKSIKMGGGLGGGSSNAAVALLALNALYDLRLNLHSLIDISREIGSDVAFFLVVYTQNGTINLHASLGALHAGLRAGVRDVSYDGATLSKGAIECHPPLDDNCVWLNTDLDRDRHFLSANVSGYGEVVEPFPEPYFQMSIITNDVVCNTSAVYSEFDRLGLEGSDPDLSVTSLELLGLASPWGLADGSGLLASREDGSVESTLLREQGRAFGAASASAARCKSPSECNDLYAPANSIYGLDSILSSLREKYTNVFFSGSGSSFFTVHMNPSNVDSDRGAYMFSGLGNDDDGAFEHCSSSDRRAIGDALNASGSLYPPHLTI